MTSECAAKADNIATPTRRRTSVPSMVEPLLAKEVLIAVALLAGIGLVLSIGSSALNVMALQ